MNADNALEMCRQAVKYGQKIGAKDVEAYFSVEKETEVSIESNYVKLAKTHQMRGLGVRVVNSGSLGFASSNSHNITDVENTVTRAVKIASVTPPDHDNIIPSPKKANLVSDLYDPLVENFGVEDAVQQAATMLSTARNYDSRISVDSGGFSTSLYKRGLVNSNGIEVEEEGSMLIWSIMGMASDNGTVSSFDIQYGASRNLNAVNTSMAALEFAKNVISSLDARKTDSFKGEVVFSPQASLEVLLDPVVHSLNSRNIHNDASYFASRIGGDVTSSDVTMIDDGAQKGELFSSNFDREGVPHKRLTLIKSGVLCSYIYNSHSASKDNVDSTGNASGTYRSAPSISTTNFIVESGNLDLINMISEIRKGLIVTRFSGNVNPVSGDFSGVAKGGKYILDGEVKYPVKEILISGNVFNLLTKITGISREIKRLPGFTIPHIRVRDVSITAG